MTFAPLNLNRVTYVTDFTKQDKPDEDAQGDDFVIPEDLSELSDEALAELNEQATNHFETLYGDGNDLTEQDLKALETLTDSLERIQAESATREQAAAERAEKGAELAARVRPGIQAQEESQDDADGDEGEADSDPSSPDGQEQQEEDPAEAQEPNAVAASTGPARISMSRVRSRAARRPPSVPQRYTTLADIMTASVDGKAFVAGQGITWEQAGQIVDRNLAGFNPNHYEAARRTGRHLSQTRAVATLTRPKPQELILTSSDPYEVDRVIAHARNEANTPQGSLTASGGWCSPSETFYDLTEMEGRDGLLSLPEIRVTRGGFRRTLGPDFLELWAKAQGFVYTEAQDIAGTYGVDEDGIGDGTAGTKPCIRVECTEWEEFRLGVDGICISAGLLMQKGFPELIARTIRGTLVGHDHIQSGRYIQRLITGSDPVTMPTPEGGAIAPLLDAIELQVTHMRSIRRIPQNTTFEAKFPMWVHSLVRSDLAKRTGTDMLAITDAQINAWFTARNISVQFLYNWQDIGGPAGDFTAWPTEVQFLLYPAGTFVRAGDDVINVSNLMDSTLLGQNDYIALFTEESWLVAKMGFDSRVITVPVCANGATSAPIPFTCPTAPAVTTTTTTV